MKIIISPAKKMKMIDDINIECTTPLFLSKTTELLNHIQSLEYSELKSYLKCSDTIAQTTYDQFQNMSLNKNTTPAILSYSGIQYQYMAPHVFTDDQQHRSSLYSKTVHLLPDDGKGLYFRIPDQGSRYRNLLCQQHHRFSGR